MKSLEKMKPEQFENELNKLHKFFTIYCENNHKNPIKHKQNIRYKDKVFNFEIKLCEECYKLLNYSIQKLQECKYEIKPKCRKCKTPCYEKEQWKHMAKVMRYSGIKLGLLKIKKAIF